MYAWFLWGNAIKVILLSFVFILCFVHQYINKELYTEFTVRHYIIGALIFLLSINSVLESDILSWIKSFFGIYIFVNVLQLKTIVKQDLYQRFFKAFGVISLVSIIGWLFFLLGVNLPHSVLYDEVYGYQFDNYYIFLNSLVLLVPRFSSIFLEPGQYAMVAVIFLHINGFKLKNVYNFAIFLSVLFTLSIAGYVIMLLSVSFLYFKKKNLIYYISVFLVLAFVWSFSQTYNDGNNIINMKITERLHYEDGKLSGNNRNSADYDKFYNKFIETPQVLFGDRGASMHREWDGGNAGYKVYIVTNGIIPTIACVLLYFLMTGFSTDKKKAFYLFFLEMLIFWQNTFPLWFAVYSTYLFGLSNYVRLVKKPEEDSETNSGEYYLV